MKKRETFTEKFYSLPPSKMKVEESLLVEGSSLVGIEIELENIPDIIHEFKYWKIVYEGSLSDDGEEFVFRKPRGGKDIIKAIRELNNIFKREKIIPIVDINTSLHIHIDIRDLYYEEYFSFILLYIIFEKVLFKYCGEERENNQFCVPTYLDELINELSSITNMGEEDMVSLISSRRGKRYCAMNILSTEKFGSLEFRMHGGTHKERKIINWINILLSMKKFAKTISSIDEIKNLISDVSMMGTDNFLKLVFGIYHDKLMYDDNNEMIYHGLRLVQEILRKKENVIPRYKIEPHSSKYNEGDISNSYSKYKEKFLSEKVRYHDDIMMNNFFLKDDQNDVPF